MISPLEEVLDYRNDAIVRRFMESWDVPFEEALDLFHETKKWLWLGAFCTQHPKGERRLAITGSLLMLDEMWHTFVLNTQAYVAFCETHFGFYLHHQPGSKEESEAQRAEYERDPEGVIARHEEQLRWQYELVYEQLGADTLTRWYSEYLDRYTEEFMMNRWRWALPPYDRVLRLEGSSDEGRALAEGGTAARR
jgi:hypothetical protein